MKRLLLAVSLLAGVAQAMPVAEMRAEDLLPMAQELRTTLKLTPNQLSLWQQVESKSKAIVRERSTRRERLQAKALELTANPKLELRDLGAMMDAETASSTAEDKQLRELWLSVNDALDDNQRQVIVTTVLEQLQRVPAHEGAPRKEGQGDKGMHQQQRGQRGGGQRGGAPGGTPTGG